MKTINDLTAIAGASVDTAADYLPVWDASASSTKKVLVSGIASSAEPPLGNPSTGDSILQSTLAGVRSWILKTVFEPALGNPASSGYVLSSTDAGARSWIDNSVYQFHSFTLYTGTYNTAAQRYISITGGGVLTTDIIRTVFPMDVTVDRLYLHVSAASNAGSGYLKILKDGNETGIAISGITTGLQSDITHSASYTAGVNEISMTFSPGSGSFDNATVSFRVKIK